MNITEQLKRQKEDSQLASLRSELAAQQEKSQIRKEQEKQLAILIQNAIFLEEDEKRKKLWIKSIPFLKQNLLERLLDAVIREDFRYKKGKRKISVELNTSAPPVKIQ